MTPARVLSDLEPQAASGPLSLNKTSSRKSRMRVMYDVGEYQDKYGINRVDRTLDNLSSRPLSPSSSSLTLNTTPFAARHDPFDQWDANPRFPSPDALEREILCIFLLARHPPLTALRPTSQCSNFTCCGLTIPDLLAHFEDSHVFFLSKQASVTDAYPSSVFASLER